MKTVYGLRNCNCGCRGLISGICYRTDIGKRRRYYHNYNHVSMYIRKQLRKHNVKHLSDAIIRKETTYYIKNYLEKS